MASAEPIEIPVRVARSFAARLRGLMLQRAGAVDAAGLLLPRCASVHTVGMRFRLDVAFVDADGTVLDVHHDLGAWRVCVCRAAAAGRIDALELAAGCAHRLGLAPGCRCRFVSLIEP